MAIVKAMSLCDSTALCVQVYCLRASPSGSLLAVGTATCIGDLAVVYVWNLAERRIIHRGALHKVCSNVLCGEACIFMTYSPLIIMPLLQGRVQSLAFSASEEWLASVGGPDDNSLVIWDVASGRSVCGAAVSATDITWFHHDPDRLATCGRDSVLCTWQVDRALQKLIRLDAKLGKICRDFTCLCISADDAFIYAGSSTGDVAEVGPASCGLNR